MTFLFTDIEGSTRLWDEDADAMRLALRRHDALLRESVERHGGVVFKTVGDAFHAAFADAGDAVVAALAAQHALLCENWAAFGSKFPAIRVRMALHSGEADERDGDYFGPALNRAARLLAAGHGGQILLSDTVGSAVADHLPAECTLKNLGEHRLKDLTRPSQIFQLLAPELGSDFPPLNTLERHRTNLPIQATSFVGRQQELAEIKGCLSDSRLVTLTGVGGSGKTRLAIQVAAELLDALEDGAWFVDLAPIADPQLVTQTVAAALGLREQSGRSLVETLIDHLRKRRLLLVLDNCEQLLTATAALLHRVIRDAPGVRVLATSREALAVAGEQVWPVPPLSVPQVDRPLASEAEVEGLRQFESVQLFVDRAALVRSEFGLTAGNAVAIAEICRRLDGLPLAIELAASRVGLLSADQIRTRLDQRFRLLTTGWRDRLPRQQTLRAAIDWSHDLLSTEERLLFRRLAVFRGGWDLAAAGAVCGGDGLDEWEVLDLLGHLVAKSLVSTRDATDGAVRYSLLETIREYARERLTEAGEESALGARHVAHFLAVAESAEPHLTAADQAVWLQRLTPDLDNFRLAFERSMADPLAAPMALRLGAVFWRYWSGTCRYTEAQKLYARLVALSLGDKHAADHALMLYLDGTALIWLMHFDEASSQLKEALRRFRALGDDRLESWVLNGLGMIAYRTGDAPTAIKCYEASIAIKRRIGPAWDVAIGLNNLAEVYLPIDVNRAEMLFQESRDTQTGMAESVQPRTWCLTTLGFGDVFFRRGDYRRAATFYRETLDVALSLANKVFVGWSLQRHSWLAAQCGRPDVAVRLLAAVHAAQQEMGMPVDDTGTGIPQSSAPDVHARILVACRDSLGDEAFEAAVAAGKSLSLEEATALAVSEGGWHD